jgi:hypothetical protein
LLSLSRSSSFRGRIMFDSVIVMAAKKENMWGMVRWLDYKVMRMWVRGRDGRKKEKRSTFLRIGHNFFRILRSCPLRVDIFLSQHFPEIPLLENVRFSIFSVTISNICIGSAKPWQQQIWMGFHYLLSPNPAELTRELMGTLMKYDWSGFRSLH